MDIENTHETAAQRSACNSEQFNSELSDIGPGPGRSRAWLQCYPSDLHRLSQTVEEILQHRRTTLSRQPALSLAQQIHRERINLRRGTQYTMQARKALKRSRGDNPASNTFILTIKKQHKRRAPARVVVTR